MLSYYATVATGVSLAVLYMGRRMFNQYMSISIPYDHDEDEDDIFYEAQGDVTVSHELPQNFALPSGDGGRVTTDFVLTRQSIVPTESNQNLVSCDSCFCCKSRKVISALFTSEVKKTNLVPQKPYAVSEPSLPTLTTIAQ